MEQKRLWHLDEIKALFAKMNFDEVVTYAKQVEIRIPVNRFKYVHQLVDHISWRIYVCGSISKLQPLINQ